MTNPIDSLSPPTAPCAFFAVCRAFWPPTHIFAHTHNIYTFDPERGDLSPFSLVSMEIKDASFFICKIANFLDGFKCLI